MKTEPVDIERIKLRYEDLWIYGRQANFDEQLEVVLDEVPKLLAEIERLRAENTALAGK